MNQTAAAVGNTSSFALADATSTFTTLHLVLIVLLALLVIAGIVYGARLKHRRVAAERAVEEHAIEAGVPPTEPAEPEAPAAIAPAPAHVEQPPVAPTQTFVAAHVEPQAPSRVEEAASFVTAPEAAPAITIAPEARVDEVTAPPSPAADPAEGPVTQLKGLGPKVAARLAELGITTVGQIAALDDTGAAALSARLGAFSGRMERDRWIEQARFLAAGDRAGFEAVFGRL